MLWPDELNEAKRTLKAKIDSLNNDFTRAFYPLNKQKIQPAPLPILMFAISVLDLFSSLEAGTNVSRGQTNRMVNFLVNYMSYEEKASRVLVQMHRHQLMHTSEPRIIIDEMTNATYGWLIGDTNKNHMKLLREEDLSKFKYDVFTLHLSIKRLIYDLSKALMKYIQKLEKEELLQDKYKVCLKLIRTQKVDLG